MADVDEQGRTEPPLAGDELATLTGFLDFHRQTLAWKTAGLDAAGLSATTAASTMTLGGILKHLAYVEENWFGYRLSNRPPALPWSEVDWAGDPDWEWRTAAADDPDELRALWSAAVEQSRRDLATAVASGWSRPAGCPSLAGRPGPESALDPGPPDRGVRAAQRTRRSAARGDRRSDGGVRADRGSGSRSVVAGADPVRSVGEDPVNPYTRRASRRGCPEGRSDG